MDDSDYIQAANRLEADSDQVRAGIERHDEDCWGLHLPLIRFSLSPQRRLRVGFLKTIAEVTDPLIRAAAQADAVVCLRVLHAAGCVLSDVLDGHGAHSVLLHDALLSGADRVLAWLLEQRICDVDAQSSTGLTPLHRAACNGRPSTVSILLAHQAFIDCVTERGETPLHLAIRTGGIAVVGQLLAAGANPGATNFDDETPLQLAVKTHSRKYVDLLLAHGAPITRDLPGLLQAFGLEMLSRPRLVASRLDHCQRSEVGKLFTSAGPEEARLLLTRGADPSSAAEYALRYNRHKLLPVIREYGRFEYGESHLRAAAASPVGMSQVLEAGTDPNSWVRHGQERLPIIFYAAVEPRADAEVIPVLLDHGADPSPPPGSGFDPLLCELASYSRCTVPLLRALVHRGLDINARSNGGYTALHVMVSTSWTPYSPDLVRAAIRLGADPDSPDGTGRTPLMLAASTQHSGAVGRVETLLREGADVHVRDASGWSVLHHFFDSAQDDEPEANIRIAALEQLIAAGAEVNAQDCRGRYPDDIGDLSRNVNQRILVRRIRARAHWEISRPTARAWGPRCQPF